MRLNDYLSWFLSLGLLAVQYLGSIRHHARLFDRNSLLFCSRDAGSGVEEILEVFNRLTDRWSVKWGRWWRLHARNRPRLRTLELMVAAVAIVFAHVGKTFLIVVSA